MISNHKIEDNILYIYFDFSYEFGKFDSLKEENILSSILKYIKEKKIKFNGKKIMLCASGIVFANILFSPITNNIDFNYKNNIIENEIYNTTNNNKDIEKEVFNNKEEILVDNKEDNVISNNTDSTKENISDSKIDIKKEETIINNTSTEDKQTITNIDNQVKEEINKDTSIDSEIKENNKEVIESNKEVIESNEEKDLTEEVKFINPVTIYRTNGSIITLELEDYLIGVLAGEMPASFNIEALKAGAVAARTYTLKYISENKKLTDNESTQTYLDNIELKVKWGSDFNKYYDKITSAVNLTKGIYMTYNGKYIDAVYHASNNGYTVSSNKVWKNDIPYLKSVESPWDINSSSYLRVKNISIEEFNKKLNIELKLDSKIELIKDNTNHIEKIIIDETEFNGIEFRQKLGLRSTDFEIKINNDFVEITTKGYGHGVGMSQYGANGMANSGYNYIEILKHYYTGIIINN